MFRAAFLLTGSATDADDLVQDALVRLIRGWRKVARADDPVAYSNRILVNVFLSGRARRWHGERPHAYPPDRAVYDSGYGRVDDLDRLRRALAGLQPRQRAAVVLRHYEQRSEAETAVLMRCPVGTVKSLTSRGLMALRERLAEDDAVKQEAP